MDATILKSDNSPVGQPDSPPESPPESPPASHGAMKIMDSTGHTTVEWDHNNPDEVKAAREMFDSMTSKGYRAFRIEGSSRQGQRIDAFDPAAERIMLIPHIAGG